MGAILVLGSALTIYGTLNDSLGTIETSSVELPLGNKIFFYKYGLVKMMKSTSMINNLWEANTPYTIDIPIGFEVNSYNHTIHQVTRDARLSVKLDPGTKQVTLDALEEIRSGNYVIFSVFYI